MPLRIHRAWALGTRVNKYLFLKILQGGVTLAFSFIIARNRCYCELCCIFTIPKCSSNAFMKVQ